MTQEQKNELLKLKEMLVEQENNTEYIAYIKDSSAFVTKSYIKDNFLEDFRNKYYKNHQEEITDDILDEWHVKQEGTGYSEQWLNYSEIDSHIDDALDNKISICELNYNIELTSILAWFGLNVDLFYDEIYGR